MFITRINPFLEAHGSKATPGMHPLMAGALSGMIALFFASYLLYLSGALEVLRSNTGNTGLLAALLSYGLLSGAIYGKVFSRAANDFRGGWLFGMSSGFFFWMIGPSSLYLLFLGKPLVTGIPSLGLMGTQLLQGLALGIVYPWVQKIIMSDNII